VPSQQQLLELYNQQKEPKHVIERLRAAGLYLASAGADQTVVVWDVLERKVLAKRVLAGTPCGASWHPGANTLALITDDGESPAVTPVSHSPRLAWLWRVCRG
jgi:hypothetical protein